MASSCLNLLQLDMLARESLESDERARALAHLAACDICTRAFAVHKSGKTLPEELRATIAGDSGRDSEPHLVDEDARMRFEADWEKGTPPQIENFLPPPDATNYPGTIEELVLIDMEYRHKAWSRGDRTEPLTDVDTYLQRFPALGTPAVVDRLRREETHLRARHSRSAKQFPELPGYEITSELGHGGMGVVYKAKQLKLNRLVAVKMLPSSRPLAPIEFVRFQIEAESLASLQHPNIVQVHEVGEHGGAPFLALELVEGGDLADRMGPEPMPSRDAARLIETLARAVHAAHLRGIVHRDLKPGNVLMTKDGIPKISDFGLAKRLESSENAVTQTGAILGTPAYMAPEQASGDIQLIGPATDVYALGAMLYELLTGRPPLEGTSMWETVEMVRTMEPTSPRRLRSDVPRDLEVICLKCLEKSQSKRYASALDLGEDLGRYLADEPIRARPASATERLRKWTRRHPTAAALFGAVTVATIAIASLGVWSYFSLREAARRADERSKMAREVVDDMYTRVADEWLSDEPHRDALQLDFLQKAATLYEEFAKESGNDPARRRDVARASFRLGQINRRLHRYPESDEKFARAIAIQDELRKQDPSVTRDLAESYNWRGEAARESGRLAPAEADYRVAIDLFESLPGGQEGVAQGRYNLGVVMMDTGRLREAEKEFDQAIQLLMRGDGTRPERQHKLAHCYINRGVLHKELGRLDQAEADDRAAIEFLTGLRQKSSRPEYKLDLAITRQNLGNVWLDRLRSTAYLDVNARDNDISLARAELTEAMSLVRGLAADFPTRPAYRKKLANVAINLATLDSLAGDLNSAQKNWVMAAEMLERLADEHKDVADYSTHLGAALGNLGWLAAAKKDWDAARGHLEKAIDHTRAGLQKNKDSPETRRTLRDHYRVLAEVAIEQGDHVRASHAAKAFAEVFGDRPQDSYYAACFLSRCIPLARQTELEMTYASDAMKMLRLAASLKEASKIERLPNESEVFAPLAADAEFAALRKSLDQ